MEHPTMSQRIATIESLPMAFEVVKAMQADRLEWDEYYRPFARQALAEIIEDQMAAAVDRYLDQLTAADAPDRRNGHYRRHLLTTLGDIELSVPRKRSIPRWQCGKVGVSRRNIMPLRMSLPGQGRPSQPGPPRVRLPPDSRNFAAPQRIPGSSQKQPPVASRGRKNGRRIEAYARACSSATLMT
jgi:hypothetical protein